MIKLDHEQFLSAEVQSRPRDAEEERLDRLKYREYSRRFVLYCFVITVMDNITAYWRIWLLVMHNNFIQC